MVKWIIYYVLVFVLSLIGCAFMDRLCRIRRTKAGTRKLILMAALWPFTISAFVITAIALAAEHKQ